MSMTLLRSKLAGVVCALVLSSCDDATNNSVLTGEFFVLQSVADQSLPAVVVIGDYTSLEVVADTLRFRNDGTGTEIFVRRPTYPDQPPGPDERIEHVFTYAVSQGTIDIAFTCPDFAAGSANSCLAPPHYRGYLTLDGIVFDMALYYAAPFRFTRKGAGF